MDLFIILGVIVLIALIVSGVLFFTLDKEEQEKLTFEPKVSLPAQAVQVPSDESKQLIETLKGLEQAQHGRRHTFWRTKTTCC